MAEQGTLPLTKQGFDKGITLYLWGTKGTKRQPERSHCCQASLCPLTPRLAMSPSLADWASTSPASRVPQSAGTHRQKQLIAGCMFTFSFNLPLSISPV